MAFGLWFFYLNKWSSVDLPSSRPIVHLLSFLGLLGKGFHRCIRFHGGDGGHGGVAVPVLQHVLPVHGRGGSSQLILHVIAARLSPPQPAPSSLSLTPPPLASPTSAAATDPAAGSPLPRRRRDRAATFDSVGLRRASGLDCELTEEKPTCNTMMLILLM